MNVALILLATTCWNLTPGFRPKLLVESNKTSVSPNHRRAHACQITFTDGCRRKSWQRRKKRVSTWCFPGQTRHMEKVAPSTSISRGRAAPTHDENFPRIPQYNSRNQEAKLHPLKRTCGTSKSRFFTCVSLIIVRSVRRTWELICESGWKRE